MLVILVRKSSIIVKKLDEFKELNAEFANMYEYLALLTVPDFARH